MSTGSNVLHLSDHILGNFVRAKYTVATFLDLSKAFDALNSSILIRKLICYGVKGRALEWFVSYFSQPKQFVNMLYVSSPTNLNDDGIAQGSCHGPFMFIVYMNDIVRCSLELNFLLYADDTTLYVSVVDSGQCRYIMNQGLSHVYRWLYMNKLSLIFSKTNYVVFNRRKQISMSVLPSISLKNVALVRKKNC